MATLEELTARLEALEGILTAPRAAVPPIQIGEYNDVPAPGSPIAAQWSQEVTRRTAHRFPSVASRDGSYPAASAGTGAVCVTTDTGTQWISNGSTWLPLGTARAASVLVAGFVGAATNNADIPWTASQNITGWGVGTTITVPSGAAGVYGITCNITYSSGTAGATAYYVITAAGTPFPVPHPGINGGACSSLILPLAAGATIKVTVSPGATMPASNCSIWINRLAQ